ncbi:MAG TPA: hypothetical protein VJT71_02470 [Pyrinomonadaceae bacterium]|nr:hypothetical protein [Pyrinomonadaceae bacterium]
MSEPGAVATGSKTRLGLNHSSVLFRRLKPALDSNEDVIPGLRSLRSLTRGYHHTAAPRLVDADIQVDAMLSSRDFIGRAQQLVEC